MCLVPLEARGQYQSNLSLCTAVIDGFHHVSFLRTEPESSAEFLLKNKHIVTFFYFNDKCSLDWVMTDMMS